jgi:hypothetical protein
MDDKHGALAWPFGAKLVHRHAAALGLDSVVAGLGHEAGCIADGTPFTCAQGTLARRSPEKLECRATGETWRNQFGCTEQPPDDLQSD